MHAHALADPRTDAHELTTSYPSVRPRTRDERVSLGLFTQGFALSLGLLIGGVGLLYHGTIGEAVDAYVLAGSVCLIAAAALFRLVRARLIERLQHELCAQGLSPWAAREQAHVTVARILQGGRPEGDDATPHGRTQGTGLYWPPPLD